MKCPDCGIKLLGSMKKCPRCAYDITTGQVDQKYLDSVSKAREQNHTPPPLQKVSKCKGSYSQDGKTAIPCEIELIDRTVLKISKSKEQNTSRRVTRAAFGLLGTLVYDAVHDGAQETLFVVKLEEIQPVEPLKTGENVYFSSGWRFNMANGRCFLLSMNKEVSSEIQEALRQK